MLIQGQEDLAQSCLYLSSNGSGRSHRSVGGRAPFIEDRDWWGRFRDPPQIRHPASSTQGESAKVSGFHLGQYLSARHGVAGAGAPRADPLRNSRIFQPLPH